MSRTPESEIDGGSILSESNMKFDLNAKGYIQFNNELIIDNRYQLYEEILIDKQTGSTAKGRYGSVFKVKDLRDGKIKALKINRIPPIEEERKRQKAKREMKKKQRKAQGKPIHSSSNNNNNNNHKKKEKTVEERYIASCKREIGVLKRISKKNKNEKYPVLVLYDSSEYLGHTYMVFPLYDMTLQQHLVNIQRYQYDLCNIDKQDYIYDHIFDINTYKFINNNNNTNNNNNNISNDNNNNNINNNINNFIRVLMHPSDVWAIYHQLIVGLSYIHNMCSVMHLDFKPKNIMINKYSYNIIKDNDKLYLIKLKEPKITLIDFSVSAKAPRDADLDEIRFTGNFGTRRYRPPEMIYGGKWNRSVDTYATAMIVLECIKHVPVIDTAYEKHKQGKKNFDISDVITMIIVQIGMPQYKKYFNKLPNMLKCLFPKNKQINNYLNNYGKNSEYNPNKKRKRKKNIDNNNNTNNNNANESSEFNQKHYTLYKNIENAKFNVQNNLLNSDEHIINVNFIKKYEGKIWNIIHLYGDEIIKKYKLLQLMNVLKKMVDWETLNRLKPEEILRVYFTSKNNNNNNNNNNNSNGNNNNNISTNNEQKINDDTDNE